MKTGLYRLTIAEAGRLLAAKELSPVDLVEASLARIEAVDAKLHSFITVTAEAARSAARAAEAEIARGGRRGPLHGIPLGLKDVFATAGVRTTAHSRLLIDNVPDADADAVARLRRAGAILLGKHATHEFTYGGVAFDLPWPPARNPWNLEHDPGGSSSGSGAAVAAGLVAGALGTDTGGSVRNPAAHCGVVGLKPTFGRVSRRGVILNSYSLDQCGPLARTVEDCALLLQAIAGYDPDDPASADRPVPDYRALLAGDVRGLRVGLVRHFFEADLPASAEVRRAMEEAVGVIAGLGAELHEVTLPPLPEFAACKVAIQLPEIYAVHEEWLATRREAYGRSFLSRILPGAGARAVDYVRARQRRDELVRRTETAMAEVDLLVTPALVAPAARLEAAAGITNLNRVEITVPFSLTGQPAIAVPMGFSAGGLPLSMQIAGRAFDEAAVLRLAHAYERATPWHRMRPPPADSPEGAAAG
ncbi:MAG: amidase [Proteobacteria bacterium]|nr:amidase [Pseudomonadota bacterium]